MDNTLTCCTCRGTDGEIEVVESGPDLIGEEETLPFEDDTIDLKRIQLKLLCMQSVIEKYQSELKTNIEFCPDEPCVDFDVELKLSKNEEISNLQGSQVKLECQVNDLVSCCKAAKTEMRNLHSLMCEKTKEILTLQKEIAALESWRRTLELEAGLCIERFEYLKNVKAEWSEVMSALEKERACYEQAEKKLVPKECYAKDKRYFVEEVGKLKQMFMELFELQQRKFSFPQDADTPPCGSEFNLAEQEYMALKKKFNDMKYGKDEEKKMCED